MNTIPLTAVIDDRPNWFLRLLGAHWQERGGLVRFSWGEWSPKWGLGLSLINWSENGDWSFHILPGFGSLYVKLRFLPRREPREQMLDSWGFSWEWGERSIYLKLGAQSKFIHLPWDLVHVRHDMLCDDGEWRKAIGSWERKDGDPSPATEAHPYKYVCRDGEVQDDIVATITVDEREWRWRWFKWLPWPRKIQRCIAVEFSAEVGERRGSWKGGCTGCGYQMWPGETPAECLRRMQRERRFD